MLLPFPVYPQLQPKCHLPIQAVLYPLAENICAIVQRSGSIIAGESPSRPPRFSLVRHGYLPVRREYLEGVDKAEEAWASVKAIPCSASLSMLGVWILDSGLKAEMSP